MTQVVNPAWKQVVEDRTAATTEPYFQTPSRLSRDLKLHWLAGLLLNQSCTVSNLPTTHDITDPVLDEITAAKFAVDGQIKERSITQPPMLIKIKTNSPDVARLQRAFGSYGLSSIPRALLVHSGVKI